jgi:hypothetical protein
MFDHYSLYRIPSQNSGSVGVIVASGIEWRAKCDNMVELTL